MQWQQINKNYAHVLWADITAGKILGKCRLKSGIDTTRAHAGFCLYSTPQLDSNHSLTKQIFKHAFSKIVYILFYIDTEGVVSRVIAANGASLILIL